jgi:hypothetical protein
MLLMLALVAAATASSEFSSSSSASSATTPMVSSNSLRGIKATTTTRKQLPSRRLQQETPKQQEANPPPVAGETKEADAKITPEATPAPQKQPQQQKDAEDDKKNPGGDVVTPSTAETTKSCDTAKTCDACEQLSTSVKTTGKGFCRWNETFHCEVVPFDSELLLEQQKYTNHCPDGSSDDDGASYSGRLQGFALLLAVLGVLLIVRQRIVNGRLGIHSSLDRALDQVASSVASSTGGGRRSRYQEVYVPSKIILNEGAPLLQGVVCVWLPLF